MIHETVSLTFDPEEVGEDFRATFSDDLARTLCLAIRSSHLISQYFYTNCLHYAKVIRKRLAQGGPLTARELLNILAGMTPGHSIIGHCELDFATELLPFVKGEKTIGFEIEVAV